MKDTKTLYQKYKDKELSLEEVLSALEADGICPALIHDDFSRWALVFTGFQDATPRPSSSSFFIDKKDWRKGVRFAVLHTLKTEEL